MKKTERKILSVLSRTLKKRIESDGDGVRSPIYYHQPKRPKNSGMQ